MTSIEWLIKKITNRQNGIFDGFPHLSLDEIYAQAIEMHRQEILDAYFEGDESGFKEPAEKYYNETYKQELTSQLPGINVNDVKPSNPQMVKENFSTKNK